MDKLRQVVEEMMVIMMKEDQVRKMAKLSMDMNYLQFRSADYREEEGGHKVEKKN